MSEPLPEPVHPGTTAAPVEPERTLTRKNNVLGLALFATYLLLCAGVVVVALIYDAVANY